MVILTKISRTFLSLSSMTGFSDSLVGNGLLASLERGLGVFMRVWEIPEECRI